MLRAAYTRGAREAFAKFAAQPSLKSVGIKTDGLPAPAKPPSATPKAEAPASPSPSLGEQAAKTAANVGMAMSTARHDGPGAVRGEPADEGRRTRSVIERAFQRNEDDFATSSMSRPAGGIPK